MKVGQIGPTFVVPGKTVIFWRVKSVASSSTLKMRKSQKKLAPVYAYTHIYARKRDGGGKSAPPESNRIKHHKNDGDDTFKFGNLKSDSSIKPPIMQ